MKQHVEAPITRGDDERFRFIYYDTFTEQNETRVLATGLRCKVKQNGVFIPGRVEHRLPDGYYFQPDQGRVDRPSFVLADGLIVKISITYNE